MAANAKTPETIPWIPPGQSQEESSNKFAHKKGSIAKQINEEVKKKRSRARKAERSNKSSITSSTTQSQILSLSDSGRGSELSSADKKGLKDKIVEIFEEDENDYEYDSEGGIRRKYPDSTFDSGRGSLGKNLL
ncbi:uncharacterized protein LOC111717397 [Eurytemora carolleeae]|uniref:uncharacterized protein LOC111717397 n=1 Tax=Eurytemora carolleeae TaxID=1294199 RepID=UPI000C788DCD|nr:uncharacterized protein LOC111717397 [Eurytemora carolleeae]|eukprot:XP_023348665.1 uncharacterized protein LOC111717397 [Eurytemora affinis]